MKKAHFLTSVIGMIFSVPVSMWSQPAQAEIMTNKHDALIRVENKVGKEVVSVRISHKYSDVYKDSLACKKVSAGSHCDAGKVDYNTGVATTGRDWWKVAWTIPDEQKTCYTDPDNFRALIDVSEQAGQWLIPLAIAGATGVAGGATTGGAGTQFAINAGGWLGDKIVGETLNSESTKGMKQHILRLEDRFDKKPTKIKIYKNKVVFDSPSGDSTTKISCETFKPDTK